MHCNCSFNSNTVGEVRFRHMFGFKAVYVMGNLKTLLKVVSHKLIYHYLMQTFQIQLELSHCFVIKNYVCWQYKESSCEERITQLNIILLFCILLLSCSHFYRQYSHKLQTNTELWPWLLCETYILNGGWVPWDSTVNAKCQNRWGYNSLGLITELKNCYRSQTRCPPD